MNYTYNVGEYFDINTILDNLIPHVLKKIVKLIILTNA